MPIYYLIYFYSVLTCVVFAEAHFGSWDLQRGAGTWIEPGLARQQADALLLPWVSNNSWSLKKSHYHPDFFSTTGPFWESGDHLEWKKAPTCVNIDPHPLHRFDFRLGYYRPNMNIYTVCITTVPLPPHTGQQFSFQHIWKFKRKGFKSFS